MRLAAELPGASAAEIIALADRLAVRALGFDTDELWDLPTAQAALGPFEEAGLAIVQLGCYRNLICVDEAVRVRAIKDVASAMNVAGATGVETVVCGGGHRDPAALTARRSVHPDNWSEAALDVMIDSCRQIVDSVDAGAAPLCLEPWVITCLGTPARIERVVRAVDHPKLGVELDLANMVTLDRYFATDRLIEECFERFGDKICLVHIKDVSLRPEPYVYHLAEVVAGDGAIAYERLFSLLAERRPQAALMVEHLHDEGDIARALGNMRALAERAGIQLS